MITALDHIALAVGDFEASADAYEALFALRAERQDPVGGARRARFRLTNMSLEIIAAEGAGPAGDRVRARLAEQGQGLLAVAFRVDDLDRAQRLLERRGVASTAAQGCARLAAETTYGLPLSLVEAAPSVPSGAIGDPTASLHALDHIVVQTPNPDRALALFGAKLGLDLRLDRTNATWGNRLLFFRCGDSVVEIGHGLADGVSDGPDLFGGLAWRTRDPQAARVRMAAVGFNVSEVRKGRKPGTEVFTVRDAPVGVPTLVLSATSD
ncbi:MAG TPA: VOC family protein [Caulobacteraceae bacterium]|jgi:catechol 2,3-dioxygenase-like lactoylglutathione lyase family enzyme